jgi:hypothetical protein
MRRSLLAGTLGLLAGCGSTNECAYVRVPAAQAPTETARVGRLVGELLAADPGRSADAEKRLLALVGSEREQLAAHAASIPHEHDPRWLHVLDEQQLLPDLPPDERVALLLWKAERPERFYVMKARAGLTEIARRDPAPLLAAVRAGVPGTGHAAVALALADRADAVPTLLDRFVESEDEDERRALAEALRSLLGEETRLRVAAPREERERRVAEIKSRLPGKDAGPEPTTGGPRG